MAELKNVNTMWRRVLREVLVAGGVIQRPALVMSVQDQHPGPGDLLIGQVIVVVSGGKPKWAYFQCPGNCGNRVQLSLDLLHPPRWTVKADFLARATISPAVYRHQTCGAHFTVQSGRIDWLDGGEHRHCSPLARVE